jgi:alkyl hydroperoxide reductase subunit AhpF
MALIRDKDRDTLREMAKGLARDVDVTLYTQRESALIVPGVIPCETCESAEQLLTELAEIAPKLKVNIVDLVENREQAEREDVVRVPTIVVGGAAEKRVRFVGFPGGYEASTFIKSLFDAGGAPDGLPQDIQNRIAATEKAVDVKVFVTPT